MTHLFGLNFYFNVNFKYFFQLFSSYYYPYHHIEKMRRKELFQSLFEFKCECIACKYNFPIADYQTILDSHVS